jgi:sugar lactone lactonase YvrE
MVEVDTKTGQLTPYPDMAWNTVRPAPDGKPEWGLVQALWDDSADHLWALDTGIAKPGDAIPPKLVEFDLTTNQPIRTYTFDGTIDVSNALNDVRVDVPNQTAYLTAAGGRGGLVVLDLRSGKSRLVLSGDKSAVADPKQHLMIGDQQALRPDGSPVVIQTDGIALSPDRQWLYYRPLTDHNYWRVPTAALRDAALSPAALSTRVQYLGSAGLSGGLIMDGQGWSGYAVRRRRRAQHRHRPHPPRQAARIPHLRAGARHAALGRRLRDQRRRSLHQRLAPERGGIPQRPPPLRPVHDLQGEAAAQVIQRYLRTAPDVGWASAHHLTPVGGPKPPYIIPVSTEALLESGELVLWHCGKRHDGTGIAHDDACQRVPRPCCLHRALSS